MRIAVGGAAQILYMPTTLTQQLGYYRDEGLDVTLQDFPGGAKALQAVLGGSADVVSGFYDHTIQMAAEGRRLQAFVNMVRYPGLVLAVSPKAKKPIERIDQLAGATAGVTAPGSSTHFFLNFLLAKRNVSREEVSVVGIGHGATAMAALDSGKVDIAVITEPAVAELLHRGTKLRFLADTRTMNGVREAFGAPEYPASVLYAPTDWIGKNRPVVQRLARAMKKTLVWINSHAASQIAAKMPAEHRGGDPALYESALIESLAMFNPNGAFSLEGAEAVRKVLGYSIPAVKDAPIDLKTTFTNEFLESA